MSNPIRPGARGGRDQFSWEKVKEDRQRINYLGSSIHGLPDKFKKGPETFWYAKETKTIPSTQDKTELESIKEKERLAMEALLGNSSKTSRSREHKSYQEDSLSEDVKKGPLRSQRGRHDADTYKRSRRVENQTYREEQRGRTKHCDDYFNRSERKYERRRDSQSPIHRYLDYNESKRKPSRSPYSSRRRSSSLRD